MSKRLFDLFFALLGIIISGLLLLILYILASIDTKPIDFYETPHCTTSGSYQMPVVANVVQNDVKTLKLKRSKPLKDKESTLDSCLQITTRA
jgi:hypothetical protein